MDTNNYKAEQAVYVKVLIGLLLLTAVTFVQPHLFMAGATFTIQMLIAVAKAWLILMYYMHLKGETLIGYMGIFALLLVVVFFIIVGIDVHNFQFSDVSHITSPAQ